MKALLHFLRASMVFALASFGAISSAQAAENVGSIDAYFPTYLGKYEIGVDDIKNDNSLSLAQKVAKYDQFLTSLKTDFVTKRTAEFQSVLRHRSAPHSCTKGGSGPTKKCGQKCAHAGPDFYTKPEWSETFSDQFAGSPTGADELSADGQYSCVTLQKSGRGKVSRRVEADFRYKPDFVAARVTQEAVDLFYRITKDRNPFN